MRESSSEKPTLVPFPSPFAVLGFSFGCLVLIAVLLETLSWCALSVYRNYWHSPLRQLQKTPEGKEYVCRGTGNGHCPIFSPSDANLMSASPAYNGYGWGEDFWKEQRAYMKSLDSSLHYEPFRLWSWSKFHGKFINVDGGPMGRIRNTVNPAPQVCDAEKRLKVWFFGGSTAWGYGVPDFATIPSYLSEKLNAQQPGCVEITNLGVEGYNSNQELIYLIEELKAGYRPDIVIFYDGYNDAITGALNPAMPSAHWYYLEFKSRFESEGLSWRVIAGQSYLMQLLSSVSGRLPGNGLPPVSHDELDSRAKATLDNYEANIKLARALARKYGFEARFFWHPVLYYGAKPLGPFERTANELAPATQPALRAVYAAAEKRSKNSEDFDFLGDVFDGVSEPLYIDQVHLGPRANEIIAAAIARVLFVGVTPPAEKDVQRLKP